MQQSENKNKKHDFTAQNTPENSTDKKVYTAPKLQQYGSIAELVQQQPDPGPDGGQPDCSLC
jgi:hypothetical protein